MTAKRASERQQEALRLAAEGLARQMASHADCAQHEPENAVGDCPGCEDRAVYEAWVAAGGRDYRWHPTGPGITLAELQRRTPAIEWTEVKRP
uniref:hypothetical protein n=1 Tax=Nonomuraea sp. CA-251285 TaxID=3240002 RepID=UPI003F492DE1